MIRNCGLQEGWLRGKPKGPNLCSELFKHSDSDGMKDEQHRFLSLLGQLPARLTVEQVAWVLNCQPHDVPILVGAKLLRPLANPAPNCVKFFATLDVLELVKDRSWLSKIPRTVNQHWQRKNARKHGRSLDGLTNGHSACVGLQVVAD